jgi:hypothetical protein
VWAFALVTSTRAWNMLLSTFSFHPTQVVSFITALTHPYRCWCGNTLDASRAPQDGILGNCQMKCKGDTGEYCGGSWGLSVYEKCDAGADCQNAQYGVVGNSTATTFEGTPGK